MSSAELARQRQLLEEEQHRRLAAEERATHARLVDQALSVTIPPSASTFTRCRFDALKSGDPQGK